MKLNGVENRKAEKKCGKEHVSLIACDSVTSTTKAFSKEVKTHIT